MIKIIKICECDRCKKEFSIDTKWNFSVSMGDVATKMDLCPDCVKALEKFMRFEAMPARENSLRNIEASTDTDVARGMIGDKLREFREREGLKQKELAEMIGIGHSTLSNIENGVNATMRQSIADKINAFVRDMGV